MPALKKTPANSRAPEQQPEQQPEQPQMCVAVQPQKAVGMSPESAKRLAAALVQAIQQYEARYGEISL